MKQPDQKFDWVDFALNAFIFAGVMYWLFLCFVGYMQRPY